MTKLSFIAIEARRHLGRIPEQGLEDLQRTLIKLCENHWSDIRGPEPSSGLARAMWAVTPHFADLLVDLYGDSGPRSSEAIWYLPPTKVLAALVLAEIERGDAEGARLAHEAMMLFETPQAREIHIDSVRSRLRGIRPERGRWHKHVHHDPFFRFLAMISEQTGRCDFEAMTVAVEYLTAIQANPVAREGDQEEKRILEFLRDIDLVFQGFEEGRIHYTLRGESKKPISGKRLEEILAQIRGNP
ncbi:MAG: hypothetical protein PHF31_16240 [Methylobacter sp.]|nr:hypothetical protein [Methylobacter sp.]